MSKGSKLARFPAKSRWFLRTALILLAAELCPWAPAGAQNQTEFRDEFNDLSKIFRTENVVVNTAEGFVTLQSSTEFISTPADFRVVLRGIDSTFIQPFDLGEVTDIDVMPDVDGSEAEERYLITDSNRPSVLIWNARLGTPIQDLLSSPATRIIDPVDAHPYLENNGTWVLITDAPDELSGRIVKIKAFTGNEPVWEFSDSLANPKDAVTLPGRREILICDTGNHRLLAVDTTAAVTSPIKWRFGSDEFNFPVDVDVVPGETDVYLVTDSRNHRVVLVQRDGNAGRIVWEYGVKGQAGSTDGYLNEPSDADPLPTGNILIADRKNDRLIEVNRQKEIVFQFANPLFSLNDADRISSGRNQDKTVVATSDSAGAGQVVKALRLAYGTQTIASELLDFGRAVDLDTLRWAGRIPAGTNIRLQIRTVNNRSDTSGTPWFGPTSETDFYTDTVAAIHPRHDGARFFQFRARLETTSPLLTPQLDSVRVSAHFFRSDTFGTILSNGIRDTPDFVTTSWRTLEFSTELPPGSEMEVRIMDAAGVNTLATRFAGQGGNNFDISNELALMNNVQTIRLLGVLRTQSAFASPKLLNWAVSWNRVQRGPSRIAFTNSTFTPVNAYRLRGSADSAYISLTDPNVLPKFDSVAVSVRSTLTGDVEDLFLRIALPARLAFVTRRGIPLLFQQELPTSNNGILETRDRDSLVVTYTDPDDPFDQSRATALVRRSFTGTIEIENAGGVAIDTTAIGEVLFVRVSGEEDNNVNPAATDTIFAVLLSNGTADQDSLPLAETAVSSGEFRSFQGVRLMREGSPRNDRQLFVQRTGDVLTARFIDPVDNARIEDFVPVMSEGPPVNILSEAFLLKIAPNPFRGSQDSELRLRAQVRTGEMVITKVEIYNMAGDLIHTVPGEGILFGPTRIVSADRGPVIASNWWSRQDGRNDRVASSTYFAKFSLELTPQAGQVERVSAIRKFIVMQ